MTYHHVCSVILSFLPCLIPPYAFRLSRVFGTKRVGWVLFSIFSLLAVLQLLRSWQPMGWHLDPGLTLDLLYFLVPVLLLIGMVHLETVFKERLRLEQEEKRLRMGLEVEVQERTADLAEANAELEEEIALRKEGEEALRKSKEQYRFLFDENPQPMWIYDLRTFRFLAFNAAALRHYGYSSAEFRRMNVSDLCPPGEVDLLVADSARTGSWVQARGPWRHCKKDGSLMQVEITTLDLTYGDGPARLVLVNDVTAQRLLQQQLLQAKKMEVTTQLAGGVADRFSKLIAVIEGEANELVQRRQGADTAELLKRIAATAGCAAGLTSQLLALVGRHPMQSHLVDLNRLVENQAGPLARLLGEDIKLDESCWENLPLIVADPGLVEQMLRNLVLNARDAMPNGGVLTLSTAAVRIDEAQARQHEEARAGAFVCLMVSDTGCGMTPEVQGRLFEPFFTTKDTGRATGLGLATVYGLAKQHSGWVEVSSQPGAGSQFTVFFPAARAAATMEARGEGGTAMGKAEAPGVEHRASNVVSEA